MTMIPHDSKPSRKCITYRGNDDVGIVVSASSCLKIELLHKNNPIKQRNLSTKIFPCFMRTDVALSKLYDKNKSNPRIF